MYLSFFNPDGTRRDGRRPVKSAVKKEEITALFFKNAVEPGTLLKTLFEKVSNDYVSAINRT